MKLATVFVLVALALCCSSASAAVCSSFLEVIDHLFKSTPSGFEAAILPFNPDPDMIDAGSQLKKLVDQLPEKVKDNVMKLTEKIVTSPQCV